MELRVLRYFLAVTREETITAAAERLHVTQPALSKQMMSLEEELGKRLFERGKRKITLTDDGIFLRSRAQEIIDLADKTEAAFSSGAETISGEVYIGGGETAGMRYISQAVRAIHGQHADIKFHLYSGDDEIIAERLNKGLLDFGVFVGRTDFTKYDYLRLPLSNHFGLIMRRDDKLADCEKIKPEILKTLPLIVPRQVMLQNDLSGWLGEGLERLNLVGTYNLIFNASFMVEDKIGYALCIDGVNNNENLCFRPFEQDIEAPVVLAWKKYQVFSKAAQKFLEILQQDIK